MKKLRLQIDELSVESFPTAAKAEEAGTVRGFDSTTGNQIICECTDEGGACGGSAGCGSYGCGTFGCSGGCGGGTNYATCATGNQIICEC
ncbi:hypothetical protein [Longimicrobium sp.]|uniref:hypothetical protein n=1 Tax=Longimicrobium sp. TaxID=2029185 RepID=UPI002B88B985|nr:hypothetical protein [Longimicrobium sp.]HSU14151.1 hypothetical protein [Longimicrobium sp.]